MPNYIKKFTDPVLKNLVPAHLPIINEYINKTLDNCTDPIAAVANIFNKSKTSIRTICNKPEAKAYISSVLDRVLENQDLLKLRLIQAQELLAFNNHKKIIEKIENEEELTEEEEFCIKAIKHTPKGDINVEFYDRTQAIKSLSEIIDIKPKDTANDTKVNIFVSTRVGMFDTDNKVATEKLNNIN